MTAWPRLDELCNGKKHRTRPEAWWSGLSTAPEQAQTWLSVNCGLAPSLGISTRDIMLQGVKQKTIFINHSKCQ